jgi:molecular chaperone GrpE
MTYRKENIQQQKIKRKSTRTKMTPKKRTKKELLQMIEELEKELETEKEISLKNLNNLKYAKADIVNIQKQNQRRLNNILERANGELLEKLLPILDELEILYSNEAGKEKILEGVKMIHNKLLRIVEREGVSPINTKGVAFNPFKHEAIMEIQTIEVPNGYIAEEVRRGYTFKDKVLRASVVKVAKTPEDIIEIKIEEDQDE